MRGILATLNLFIPRAALCITIAAITLLNRHDVASAKIFVLAYYFNVLSQTIGGMFVKGFAEISEFFTATKRLEVIFSQGEIAPVSRKVW